MTKPDIVWMPGRHSTKSFAWDDSAPGNFELERQRWHKLRNIAMAGLQTIEV